MRDAPQSAGSAPYVALRPGDVVDGFELLERLHQGGMATLWRVRRAPGGASGACGHEHEPDADATGSGPPADGAPLLMKVPRLRDIDDPAAIVGFEVEQMILPRLSGPHVPRFVAAGGLEAHPYLVMERIEGDALRPRLDHAPLPAHEVAAIGVRVAQAIHALHLQGVIHHDVKPSNVLFRATGEAVLVDFGLARHDQLPDLLAEEFRLPMGTGPYISPEQVLGIRNDPRSDLYALGVMLYHFATGVRPFGFPTTVGGLKRRLWRDPVPPRALRADVPPWLQEVVLHCLETDPARRYQSAAQVAFDLAHPAQVALGARASRMRADDWRTVLRRRWQAIGRERCERQSARTQAGSAPIVMVAVDLSRGMEALADALAAAVARVHRTEPGARLACVTVMRTHRIAIDDHLDAQGHNRHAMQLVQLRHWARALETDADRVTYHVLEAPDPASAIVEFARNNQVDHIVIGSRGSSTLRRYLGSVSAQVVAEAPCTVTVVRSAGHADDDAPRPPPDDARRAPALTGDPA